MNKFKNTYDKLAKIYMESVQPINEQNGAKVYIVVYETQYEGQTLMGIYSSEEAAKQALQQATADSDSTAYSVKEIAMDQSPNWDLVSKSRSI